MHDFKKVAKEIIKTLGMNIGYYEEENTLAVVAILEATESATPSGQAELALLSAETCEWKLEDPDNGAWESQCGMIFQIIDGTPKDNDMKFCCRCGRKLVGI